MSNDSPVMNADDTGDTGDTGDSGSVPNTDSGDGLPRADVQAVSASGDEGSWIFLVTLFSDDVGCEHYADWWELVGEDGVLLSRRTLRHSHVDEQPFARDGDPVAIAGNLTIWVRGHQNDRGYGGAAMTGSALAGFHIAEWPPGLGDGLELQEPQPEDCRY
jgi:hypothetical protein